MDKNKIQQFDVVAKVKEILIAAGVNMDNLKDMECRRNHSPTACDCLTLPIDTGTPVSVEFEYLKEYDVKRQRAPGKEIQEISKTIDALKKGIIFNHFKLEITGCGNVTVASRQPKKIFFKVSTLEADEWPESFVIEVDGEPMTIEPTTPVINKDGNITFKIPGAEPVAEFIVPPLKKKTKKKTKYIMEDK